VIVESLEAVLPPKILPVALRLASLVAVFLVARTKLDKRFVLLPRPT